MKYLLPCKCGQSVEIEPNQAGQTIDCVCGEKLTAPSMLQIKTLSEASEKPTQQHKKRNISFRMILAACCSTIVCLALTAFFWKFEAGAWYVLFRGLSAASICTSLVFVIREWTKSPLAEDTVLRRTFFVLGVALLFPTFPLASHLYEYPPQPRDVLLKRVFYTWGSQNRVLPRDTFAIPPLERTFLLIQEDTIDRMSPMDLIFYFQTLESPTFSYEFQENYEGIKDTYRIWVTLSIILLILSIGSVVTSFFMPKQTVVVTGWSGSEWE